MRERKRVYNFIISTIKEIIAIFFVYSNYNHKRKNTTEINLSNTTHYTTAFAHMRRTNFK